MKDESEWVKIPHHHPAIVSKELYEQVKAKILRFKCPKTERNYTLRAKVACGCCRHAMQLVPRKTPAFVCHYTKVDKSAECYRLEIGEQELESLLYEIISKQAQVIMNTDRIDTTSGLVVRAEQQAEYNRQIERLRDDKRVLYECFVLKELDTDAYKLKKAVIDAELDQVTRAFNTLNKETAVLAVEKASDDEIRKLAGTALGENKLSRSLVDLLIDKVYIYPENQVEIEWKVADFAAIINQNKERMRYV